MKIRAFLAAFALVAAAASAQAATVTFTDNIAAGFVDVFYEVSPGAEFLNWELTCIPEAGELLDPTKSQKSFNAESGPAPFDTFVNTVFSSVGAGPASYVHSEYNPGSAFPPVAADPNPTPGGTPSRLRWNVFDTATGDGNIDGFTPYHMARVMYSQGARGDITALFFDTATVLGGGELFSGQFGIPEPATIAMAGMGLIGMIGVARRRKA